MATSPKVESFLQNWKKIFVASCLFAVLLDPLFLYIPMMKDDIKCMMSDRNLKIAALLSRSLTDLLYIFDIIFQIYTSDKKFFVPTIIKTMWGSYNILIDILSILPLPQVAILIIFSKMSDLRSLTAIRMVIMNLFALLQYVPRVLRIYLSCKEIKMTPKKDTGVTAKWVKGLLHFFMYILSCHVLGAIYYFFAIQCMATCWHNACRKANGCDTSTFGCYDHHTDRNITFLNDLCPISPVNTTLFDSGIYITVLQSGIMGSTNYFQKFSNCFWWGLRNLSSLGSNLQPSVDGWENLFAAFTSIIGLLLLLYLIGNLQTYMQLGTQRTEAHRHRMNMEQKMKEKDKETDLWLSANCIPKGLHEDMKLKIMEKVQQEVEENRNADLDYILSILPLDLQSYIKDCTPMARLNQVPMLRNMDEDVLRRICPYLERREFDDNSIIIEKGEPLDMMLFIVDGLVSIETRDGSSSSNNNLQQRPRRAGKVCGEELLLWPLSVSYPDNVTLATESAKAIGHVEALVLTARDLRRALTFYQIKKDYLVGMMRRTFSAKELEMATDNYHPNRIIRRKGNYASFYKGVLPDDDKTVVAVKKYTTIYHQYAAIEAAVASQTNHINVVRFLGACVEPQPQALVFEYIPNGTLFEHIHREAAAGSFEGSSSSPTALLSLDLRLKIASETAGALAYLHSLTPPIIHLFLSTKHILLDDHYTAKLSAIGQWQITFRESDYLNQGYFDPNFELYCAAEKGDVYSFGVVLAELLTSQKPASPYRGEEPPLATCLLSSMEEGRLNQILDGKIIFNEATSETAKKVADLAKRCLRSKREERPSMEQVAVELEGLRKFMAEYQRGEPSFSNSPTSLQP
ncbi:hypothetical protein PRUPE_2G224000 [Prunus persica]|uniref:Cyclic nucleotide-binding domain-containing protein n=1 Tax=Prunus persica TaxID=3760 RepID=M5XT61_PRUPE|nr:hypothetical protein PRUPE_2G224000 [Prunus persica]